MKIYYNIMIVDIGKKNMDLQLMNILQLKWMLFILIQKNYYKLIFKIITQFIMKIYIIYSEIQYKFQQI